MLTVPARPVLGWPTFGGMRNAASPCMLDLPQRYYTTSGRASILLALEALGIGRADRVLVPTYHCPSMIAPLVALGAVPYFYPIGTLGQPLQPWLDAADLSGVKALLVAHLFGLPQPMALHRRWCDEHGLALVEDCAHALFGYSDDQPVGSWGDAAIGSLTKFLPVSEGGCIVLNRPELTMPKLDPVGITVGAKAALDMIEVGAIHGKLAGLGGFATGLMKGLRAMRRHPPSVITAPTSADSPGSDSDFRIDARLSHRHVATPCRWATDLVPRERIARLRRHHFAEYAKALAGRPHLRPLLPDMSPDAAPYAFPLWVDEPEPGYAELRRLRVPVSRWDRLWPGVQRIEGDEGVVWSRHVLQLACHQDMTDDDRRNVVETIARVYPAPPTDSRAGTMPSRTMPSELNP